MTGPAQGDADPRVPSWDADAWASRREVCARASRWEAWRPSLGLVVLAMLLTVAGLPLLGLSLVRLYENQLVRQAEAELIGQSAVLAAVVAREVAADPERERLLGPAVPDSDPGPIEARLDLTVDPVLDRRPEAVRVEPQSAETRSADSVPAAAALAGRLAPLLPRIRATTLAGFRITDRAGVVLAGGDEVGFSLAGIEEVDAALAGRFRAVMRVRRSKHPQPPLYSLSRGTGVRVFVAMPVRVEGRMAGVVYASRTPDNVVRLLYGERGKVGLVLLAVLGATSAIALVFTRTIGRPIQALMARAAALGQGRPVPVDPAARYGTREIAGLARSLEAMAARLRARSDYTAAFANHVSHELKTPLTAIQGAAELLRDHDDARGDGAAMSAAERVRFLDNIVSDAARLAALLRRLRDLARAEAVERGGSTTPEAVAAGLRARFPGLAIRVEDPSVLLVPLSAENAGIVFGHLADNALRHGATRLSLHAVAADGRLRIRVADDGPGIPQADRARVFEPFYTTRREAGGTGMGLGIVRALLRAHGGSIEALAGTEGAAFALTLPSPADE